MSVPFTIQRHTTAEGVHFDLLIASGPKPATWRLDRLPIDLPPGEALPADRLADHRAIYLTYEGPLSGGRGLVSPADTGECQLLVRQEDLWVVAFSGALVRGPFTLRRLEGTRWSLSSGDDRPATRTA